MNLSFKSRKLERACLEEKFSNKEWGNAIAAKVRLRVVELRAVETLADVSKLPPARCLALTLNRKGQYAVTVKDQWRLIFTPAEDPPPRLPDGGLDERNVRSIVILELEDYHER